MQAMWVARQFQTVPVRLSRGFRSGFLEVNPSQEERGSKSGFNGI